MVISVKRNSDYGTLSLSDTKTIDVWKECFSSESERIAELGEKFMRYFMKNATKEGVLFKTIKEITGELNMPHQTLSKILKTLEDQKIIYRRNGIIGLWKE
ncbi:replication protein RepL [Planomicrobium soli]|uniref:Replication protein RepL n=1 Tax=Planomicrobium soli TaxID=1176648 RepID=A0A2P8GCD8_9BACL|nr:replication/maintenance protein RepL [Planomicrobium soli]PSL31640.1 replication protein RepL [Planomicrobium soli]